MFTPIREADDKLERLRQQRAEAAQAAREATEARHLARLQPAPDPTAQARIRIDAERQRLDEALAAQRLAREPAPAWELVVPVGAGRGLYLSGVAQLLASLPRENVLAALRHAEIIE